MINRLQSLNWVSVQQLPAQEPLVQHNRGKRESLRCAFQGWKDAWISQPNLRFHVYTAAAVIAFSALLGLALIEWLWISFAIGMVIFSELMNTVIEQTVDLAVGLSPDPLARQVKDMAAGCVLFACLLAVVIGVFTLGPHLIISG